ncbi:hypothetical protein D3C77_366480 [compost metagenome]
MNGVPAVTITRGVERIVTLKQGASVVEIRQAVTPRLSVISLGVQGPVGVLAENVLQRTLQAERNAVLALELAQGADAALAALIGGLQEAFTYHAGAISAQEE